MKQRTIPGNYVTTVVAAFLLAAIFTLPASVFAQDKTADQTNMEILREKLKADKKLVVAANMDLTDSESKAFWPIYDEYQKELAGLNERLKKTVLGYAKAYNADTLTDAGAKKLSDEAIAIDEAEVKMRKAFSTKLGKALPGKKAARYLQIENKIRGLLRYELASEIPLAK